MSIKLFYVATVAPVSLIQLLQIQNLVNFNTFLMIFVNILVFIN